MNGDGCSVLCRIEASFECPYNVPGDISFCSKTASCGNNRIEADEECDDGNRRNSDGCDSTCKIERESHRCASGTFGTNCYNEDFCPNGHPLLEQPLSSDVIAVLSQSQFAGINTLSQLVQSLIIKDGVGAYENI